MKQADISKLKRQFSLDNEKLNVGKIAIGVITRETVQQLKVCEFNLLDDVERLIYMKLMKGSLGGKVGKSLLEYEVPPENFKSDNGVKRLYDINKNKDINEDTMRDFMLDLVKKSLYDMPVCVILANVLYNIPNDEEETDEDFCDDGDVFDFLLCNIIPLTFAEAELYFSEEKSELLKRRNDDGSLLLGNKITDTIMYPVLNDGYSDVNYVLYRTKDAKNPNQSIIEDFLKCEYTMSGVDEEKRITDTLYGTFGEAVEYDAIIGLKNDVKKMEKEDADNPEMTMVSGTDLANSIKEAGYDESVAEKFETKYRENFGENALVKSVNVLNTETTVYKTGDVKVTVKQKSIDKVSIEKVKGLKCIVIPLDETLTVDGIIVKV